MTIQITRRPPPPERRESLTRFAVRRSDWIQGDFELIGRIRTAYGRDRAYPVTRLLFSVATQTQRHETSLDLEAVRELRDALTEILEQEETT